MLIDTLGDDASIIPVTYMNSAANLKAFCGRNGGIVCTSSNAPAVVKWAFSHGKRVLFFPDEHLGRNTALKYGIPEEQMVVWDPKDPMASDNADEEIERSRIILWKGYCTTHMRFNVQQIGLSFCFWSFLAVIAVIALDAGVPSTLRPALIVSAVYAYNLTFRTYTLDATLVIAVTFLGTAVAATILPWRKKRLYENSPMARYKVGGIPLITISGGITALFLGWNLYKWLWPPASKGRWRQAPYHCPAPRISAR